MEGKDYNAGTGDKHREKQGKEQQDGGRASLTATSHELVSAAYETHLC